MNPFFFGSSDQPLFGVHHPPRSSEGRTAGVLLCYPMGQEYMRAHRAFRQLALLLSRAGFHVMRFDYFGTGDSAGDGEDATVERWIDDVGTALDELKETADVDDLAIVGLRVGALLSAFAATRREDVSQLVLWDPVTSGKAYMEEVLADHTGESIAPTAGGSGPNRQQSIGVMGFPISPALRLGIERLQLTDVVASIKAESFVVVSSEDEVERTLAAFRSGGRDRTTFQCVPSEGSWNEVDNFGSALIPQAIIREIVKYLSERVRS